MVGFAMSFKGRTQISRTHILTSSYFCAAQTYRDNVVGLLRYLHHVQPTGLLIILAILAARS